MHVAAFALSGCWCRKFALVGQHGAVAREPSSISWGSSPCACSLHTEHAEVRPAVVMPLPSRASPRTAARLLRLSVHAHNSLCLHCVGLASLLIQCNRRATHGWVASLVSVQGLDCNQHYSSRSGELNVKFECSRVASILCFPGK